MGSMGGMHGPPTLAVSSQAETCRPSDFLPNLQHRANPHPSTAQLASPPLPWSRGKCHGKSRPQNPAGPLIAKRARAPSLATGLSRGFMLSLALNPPRLTGIRWRSLASAGTPSVSCSSRPPLHPSPYPQSRRRPRGICQLISGYSPALPGRYFTWPVHFCQRAREQAGELPERE